MKYYAIALFIIILISRLTFLSNDLGLDPDSYRFGLNAEKMMAEHRYYYSRSPGNPLYELLNAPLLVYGGGWLTNLGTILSCMAGLLAFYLILLHYGFRRPLWLLGIFAFMPVSWINSFVTMDYWWSLALNLWSFYAALKRRYTWAAILTGISFGFRVPAGFMIFPILLLIWNQEGRWIKVVQAFAVFILSALISFSPMWLTYGFGRFNYAPYEHPFVVGAYRAVRFIFGLPALTLLIAAVAITVYEFLSKKQKFDRGIIREAGPWVLWLVLTAGMFWKNPADPAYLLPAVPFLLILLARFIRVGWWLPIGALIVLNNFVAFFAVDAQAYKRNSSFAMHLAGRGVLLHHLEDVAACNRELHELQTLKLRSAEDGSQPLILVSAFWPRVYYFLHDQVTNQRDLGVSPNRSTIIKVGDRWFGRDLSRDDLEMLMSQNFRVYYTLDADYSTRSIYRYRLAETGALELNTAGLNF